MYARQRTLFGARGNNLPSQFIDEIPANLVERERKARSFGSAIAAAASGWRPSSAGATTQLQGIAPRDELPQISVGDNVEHDQLGEGVVDRHGRRRPGDRPLPLRRLGAPPAPGLRTAQAHLTRPGLPAQRRWYHPPRGAISSVGRAPARQAGGHWFEPSIAHTRITAKTCTSASFATPCRRGWTAGRHRCSRESDRGGPVPAVDLPLHRATFVEFDAGVGDELAHDVRDQAPRLPRAWLATRAA